MSKTATKKMKFGEDKFVDGELTYQKGKVYNIPVASVDRWQKRGGELVIDATGTDEEIEDDLDASLATELAEEGKISETEKQDALSEDEDALEDEPKEKAKGKASKKNRK